MSQYSATSFLFAPDGKGRWKNEISKEQRSFSVDFSRHYVEQTVREMNKTKSVTFHREPQDSDLGKRCSCQKMQSRMSKDANMMSGLKRNMDNYPMEHTQSDTRIMQEKLRQFTNHKKKLTRMQEKESRKLLEYNKQRFESLLQQTDNACLQRGISGMSEENADQLPRGSINARDEQKRQRTSQLAKRSDPEHTLPAERKLNHLRGQCKAQPRICRHIHKISRQYKVVSTATPAISEARWKLGQVAAGSKFLLVPLQDQAKVESELVVDVDKQAVSEVADLPEEEEDKKMSMATIKTQASTYKRISEVPEEITEESEEHCWIDDATVSSIEDPKDASGVGTPKEIERNEQLEVIRESRETDTESSLPHRRRKSSVKSPTLARQSISRYPRGSVAYSEAAKMKTFREENAVIEEAIESEEPQAESETESECQPEEEVEPEPPHLICPSSAAKSHNSEIKIWLKMSPFSAASTTLPFYT